MAVSISVCGYLFSADSEGVYIPESLLLPGGIRSGWCGTPNTPLIFWWCAGGERGFRSLPRRCGWVDPLTRPGGVRELFLCVGDLVF